MTYKIKRVGMYTALFLVLSLSLFVMDSLAHGSGVSYEENIGEYLVDIGYTSDPILEDAQMRFDYELYDSQTNESVSFTNIWVRIEHEGKLFFAGGIHDPIYGAAGFSYSFAEPGPHTMFVRYENSTTTLVETTFSFEVQPADVSFFEQSFSGAILAILAGILGFVMMLGAVLLVWMHRRNKSGAKAIVSKKEVEKPKVLQVEKEEVKVEKKEMSKPTEKKDTEETPLLDMQGVLFIFLGVGLVVGLYFGYMTISSMLNEGDAPTVANSEAKPPMVLTENQIEIVLTDKGFVPSEVTIKKGTEIVFTTTVDRPFWPASNLHPTHEIYSDFDPKRPVAPDEAWSFVFDEAGVWNMHDHIRSYFTGTIYVEE